MSHYPPNESPQTHIDLESGKPQLPPIKDGLSMNFNSYYYEPGLITLGNALIISATGGLIMCTISAALPWSAYIILKGRNHGRIFDICLITGAILLPPPAGALGAAIVNKAMIATLLVVRGAIEKFRINMKQIDCR
ncbi:hypothetical protein BDQ17DRAFT_1334213 [Cyathus striatus]|nr:hypothetical protein BDQ17DRAFT_1334213 [Cyathus striatus]